jgi:tripartite-type tricarboxylate transporter receptor subunit TctC
MFDENSNRRAFLRHVGAAAGGVSTVALAGCSGDGGDGSDGSDGDGGDGGDGGSDGGDGGDGGDDSMDYPSESIRSVVPYASGGGFDAYARLSEPYWEEYLDGTVNVENVTGGGGVTGGTQVYNADPDGTTMLIWAPGEALPSQIGQDVGYDIRDMSHIGFMTQTPAALILRENANISNWSEFTNNVGSLNFATQGVGTMAHVGMEMMAELTGDFSRDNLNYVHYGGTGEVLSGLEREEANAFLITAGDSGAKVVNGIEGTKMFLVLSEPGSIQSYFQNAGVEPDFYAPDIDTSGLDQMGTIAGMKRFFAGPPDVPDEILQIQRDAFQQIINDDDFTSEALEAQRPVIEPGDHTVVGDVIQQSYDLMTSDPYQGILEEVLSG